MFITVSELANKINNLQRFELKELHNDTDIIKIIVFVTCNNTRIDYFVDTRDGRECYTEYTVPDSIIKLINRYNPVYKEIDTSGNETIVYGF